MREWTEEEEQRIIEQAKAGDPEANYELSQWALLRSEEEPDEPRWNRLAAKCLVKAAQAGYEPARQQMDALLHPGKAPEAAADAPAPKPKRAEPAEPVSLNDARRAARRAPVQQTTARRVQPSEPEDEYDDDSFDVDDPDWDDDEEDPAPRRSRGGRSRDRQPAQKDRGGRKKQGERTPAQKWGDAQWRKMEIICVAICAVLLAFIAVMIIMNRGGVTGGSGGGSSAIPPASQAAPAETPGTTQAPPYPDDATKAAIKAADLTIHPENEDYVTSSTTATVSVGNTALRMRKGPNTTYDQVGELPDETVVSVYAQKNDWYLVYYDGGETPVYGWCNGQYLILGPGTTTAPTDDPGASVG